MRAAIGQLDRPGGPFQVRRSRRILQLLGPLLQLLGLQQQRSLPELMPILLSFAACWRSCSAVLMSRW